MALKQMDDLEKFQGTGQFGRAYETMLGNDSHASGSVDITLAEQMVKLFAQMSSYLYRVFTPTDVSYRRGSRPELEHHVVQAVAGGNGDKEQLEGIIEFCRGLGEWAVEGLDDLLLGGTEEMIVERGSDWCTDVARITCQVAGLPARIVSLFNTGQAYSGHSIIEVYHAGSWGAADPVNGILYRLPNRAPDTTLELMNDHSLIQLAWKDERNFYADPGQFAGAAISNYFVSDSPNYDFAVSGVNDYNRAVLEMSGRGWPGGLRWLHGEDRE